MKRDGSLAEGPVGGALTQLKHSVEERLSRRDSPIGVRGLDVNFTGFESIVNKFPYVSIPQKVSKLFKLLGAQLKLIGSS